MAGQVIHDDHISSGQCWRELIFHIGFEDHPVHGGINDPWRSQGMASQGGNEGLGFPVAERDMRREPLAERRPACPFGQLGVG